MIRKILRFESVIMFLTVLQWLVLSMATGALVGTGVSFFLMALFWVMGKSLALPLWVQLLALPLAGLLNGVLLYYGKRLNKTGLSDAMIAAIHEQDGKMPFRVFPIKPLAAFLTLSAGGSAGKEGPCSYLGAMLGSGLGRALRLNIALQKRLIACGVSAGFATVFGTPVAGAIYGVEILAIGRLRHDFLLPAMIAGVSAYLVAQYWGLPYDVYAVDFPKISALDFVKSIGLGVAAGLAARFYVDVYHGLCDFSDWLREVFALWPPILPLFGGTILALFYLVLPSDYFGLSTGIMDVALAGGAVPLTAFLWKALLVGITLGFGFYGGVVTPQFVIGALSGSVMAPLLGFDPALGAAIGFVAAVAAASNTPVAAMLISVELFGGESLLYTAVAAMCAYLMIGHRSIYPKQLFAYAKSSWLPIQFEQEVGREKLHLSEGIREWREKWGRHVE